MPTSGDKWRHGGLEDPTIIVAQRLQRPAFALSLLLLLSEMVQEVIIS